MNVYDNRRKMMVTPNPMTVNELIEMVEGASDIPGGNDLSEGDKLVMQ